MRTTAQLASVSTLALVLTACGSATAPQDPQAGGTDSAASAEATTAEGTSAEAHTTEGTTTEPGGPITVTDHAGREVTIEEPADSVFGAGPPASTLLYTFDRDALAGWNSEPGENMAEHIPEDYLDLPVLGRGFGSEGTINPEELLEQGVDLIVDAGEVSERFADSADALQEASGIPVILLSTDFDKLDETYQVLGEVTGSPERAAELADAVTNITGTVAEGAATIDPEDQLDVYYAAGDDGLSTSPAGSIHTRIIEAVGATNVVTISDEISGRIDVNAEQVLAWDPDFVLLSPSDEQSVLATDPAASTSIGSVAALQDGRYAVAPAAPWSWVDRPPSVNQLIGLLWVAETLYPDVYDIDLTSEVVDFYDTFYQVELDEDAASSMLEGEDGR